MKYWFKYLLLFVVFTIGWYTAVRPNRFFGQSDGLSRKFAGHTSEHLYNNPGHSVLTGDKVIPVVKVEPVGKEATLTLEDGSTRKVTLNEPWPKEMAKAVREILPESKPTPVPTPKYLSLPGRFTATPGGTPSASEAQYGFDIWGKRVTFYRVDPNSTVTYEARWADGSVRYATEGPNGCEGDIAGARSVKVYASPEADVIVKTDNPKPRR